MHLRPEVRGVVESPLVQIATIAERTAGALKLCYGESDMPTPPFICQAADEAMRNGHTFYTHTAGSPGLREAIASKIFELQGVAYRPSEVMATVGASMAIFLAIRACVGPGDNALIVSPAYAIFTNAVILSGGEPRAVPLVREGGRFRLDVDRLRAAVDAGTRLIIINSPSNPTGWTMTREEQQALAELAGRHDLMILADEVYERIVFDAPVAPSLARVVQDKERLIVVNSFSKTYNMTGWRLGWAQASERLIRRMYTAAEFITSNPAAMVQEAGIAALREGEPYVRDLREIYRKRRAQVLDALSAMADVSMPEPEGAFYAFPRIAGAADSARFAEDLLRDTGVALAPGVAFGAAGEGSVRLCFAASEATLADALGRLRTFMAGSGAIASRRAQGVQ
jgi:hypothetical protein